MIKKIISLLFIGIFALPLMAQKGFNIKRLQKADGQYYTIITGPDSLQSYVLADTTFLIGLGEFVLNKIAANPNFWTNSGSNTYLTETGDNVGIGTTTPSAKLEVTEDIKVNGLSFGTGGGNVFSNLRLGDGALNANTTGSTNVAIGGNALNDNISGSLNVAIGFNSLSLSTASTNIAIGGSSMQNNTSGVNNVGIGYRALRDNSTASNNMAIGANTLLNSTTGGNNVAIGFGTMSNAGGNNKDNVGVGLSTLNSVQSRFNVAIGSAALFRTTIGEYNTAIGTNALYNNNLGYWNIGIGGNALNSLTGDNSGNIAIGYQAGQNYQGVKSVFIGHQAGRDETNSNRLYIENSNSTSPLVYGEFDNNFIKINGGLQVTGYLKDSSGDVGANGQKLISTGTGTNWVDDSGAAETDPVFVASQANNITNSGSGLVVTGTERTNWNNAFSWGDHSGLYETAFSKNTAFNKNFGTTAGTVLEGNTALFDGAWSSLSGVPAGFADGVDNDTDTNNYPTSLSVTGTSTKTITIGRNGLSNLVATFTDESGSGGDGNNYVSGLSFTTPSNILTLNRLGLSDLNLSLSNIQPAWNNITGMPSGFADGVDNTGSDGNNYPTSFSTLSNNILTLNRNGLSPITTDLSPLQANWNLIFNKPSGFSDNVDNNDYISSSTLSNTTLNLNGSGSAGTAINLINVTDFSSVDYILNAGQAGNTYTSASPTYIQTSADNILLADNRAGRMFVIQVHSGNAQINTTSGTVIVDGVAYTNGSYQQISGTTNAYIRNEFNTHWYVLKF